jgi:hypothetical protein
VIIRSKIARMRRSMKVRRDRRRGGVMKEEGKKREAAKSKSEGSENSECLGRQVANKEKQRKKELHR